MENEYIYDKPNSCTFPNKDVYNCFYRTIWNAHPINVVPNDIQDDSVYLSNNIDTKNLVYDGFHRTLVSHSWKVL